MNTPAIVLAAALLLTACGDDPRPQRGPSGAATATPPAPAVATDPPCAERDCDCAHFNSHGEAQAFFERHAPGDRHRLDSDHDGVACELL